MLAGSLLSKLHDERNCVIRTLVSAALPVSYDCLSPTNLPRDYWPLRPTSTLTADRIFAMAMASLSDFGGRNRAGVFVLAFAPGE